MVHVTEFSVIDPWKYPLSEIGILVPNHNSELDRARILLLHPQQTESAFHTRLLFGDVWMFSLLTL